MRRNTLPLLALMTLVGAACGGPGVVVRSGPTEDVFVPQVVDFEGDVGSGVSMATDADGNPHLLYLAFEEQPAPGGGPAPEDPSAPALPAIKHAHLVQNLWTRSVVAEDRSDLEAESQTAIAVDEEGVHHVAWAAGGRLFYSHNTEGEFSEPDEVSAGVAGGLSMAVGADGVPRIAFVEETGAEGPGALILVATVGETGDAIETAAEAADQETPNTAVGVAGDRVLVAFGDSGRTMLARSGPTWTSEVADRDGGFGVGMDVDQDGNPHLAYANSAGDVKHAHSIGGGPWEVSEVGDGARGSTTIALDNEGVHHVAWQTGEGISYASNQEGEFASESVPGSAGGEMPRLGAGAEGTLYLAWYDTEDTDLMMAVRSDREPLLALPEPSPTGGQPTGQPTGPAPCEPSGTQLSVTAQNLAFDTDCLAAPAGEAFTIEFDNQDTVPHNVAIYESQGGTAFFQGEVFGGPDARTYEPDPIAESGQFYFQCDVHPTMSGTFVVQ